MAYIVIYNICIVYKTEEEEELTVINAGITEITESTGLNNVTDDVSYDSLIFWNHSTTGYTEYTFCVTSTFLYLQDD